MKIMGYPTVQYGLREDTVSVQYPEVAEKLSPGTRPCGAPAERAGHDGGLATGAVSAIPAEDSDGGARERRMGNALTHPAVLRRAG